MYRRMSKGQMVDEIMKDEYSNYSYEAATAIVDYLEEMEDDAGEMEFDLAWIRGVFDEYDSINEARKEMKEDLEYANVIRLPNGSVLVALEN